MANITTSLVIVGGGGGGSGTNGAGDIWGGGGGGSGGVSTLTAQTLNTSINYTVTVGAGGAQGRVTFNGSVLCNEPSVQGGNGSISSLVGTGVNLMVGGGGAGTPAPNGDNGSGAGGAAGVPDGVAGNRQSPIARNNFAAGTGGVNSTGFGSGGNGNGQSPFACPTSGATGRVTVSYTSSIRQFNGGTITSTGTGSSTVWTHTFSTSGTFTLSGLGGLSSGFGGNGGNLGQAGQTGGSNTDGIVGGAGGAAGDAVHRNGNTVTILGNTPIGAIV